MVMARYSLFLLLSYLAGLGVLPRVWAETIPAATDAPKPLAPEESRKRFHLRDGFGIELVAAEPHLAEPTGMCFDARGRIFVCELHGYNLDGYFDIVELNKSGVLDKKVRRIPASKEAERRAAQETYGTVKLLEDTDGDGRIDRMSVFADRLPPCYGVIAARDGVIALCAPDIFFLADRDGDGMAEVREKLFTGFGVGELWTRISNPRWGVDNWIYAASGQGSSGTIRGPHLKGEVRLGNTCFRFKPDGTRLESVSGGTSGYGLAFDDWDDRFLCTNQQHALFVAPLPYHDLARNPYHASVNPVSNICTYGHPARVHRTSQPDPWRLKRGEQAAWVKFYGSAETDTGLFTSACAPLVYRGNLFPEEYRGNHLSCEPAQNLIHRCVLEPKSAGFVAKRADEGKEFLTSTDQWFRPVNLTVGPEGALYVVDMYREIIEDYSAIPRYLQQQYVKGLINGKDRGRIWRIVPQKHPNPRPSSNLAGRESADLLVELSSGNAWRRLTAQRLLVERGDKKVIPALKELCRDEPTPQGRLHALYTLDGLDALEPRLVERALDDKHHGVRVHALRLAQRWLGTDAELLRRVLDLVDDPHPKLRLQLALSLGESDSDKTLAILARLAEREEDDRWMEAAILSAVPGRAVRLAEILVSRREEKGAGGRLLIPLASVAGARGQTEEIAVLLRIIAGLRGVGAASAQEKILTGLTEGLSRHRTRPAVSAEGQAALEQLLGNAADSMKPQLLRVAGLLRLKDSRSLRGLRAAAIQTAVDPERPRGERIRALTLLTGAEAADLQPLADLLEPRQPLDVQEAAVRVLAAVEGSQTTSLLLHGWSGYSPHMQTTVLEAICSRQDRLPALLDALEKKIVDPASLSPLRQTQLLKNPDAKLRQRAKTLLANPVLRADRKPILERYQASLTAKRDSRRGKEVFEQQCMKCHQLNGQGFAVGPDLAAMQNRPNESLLIDILDPSSTITAGYRTYFVTAKNGKTYTGTLAAETATSITLRREKGEQDVILRRDIDQMSASPTSLMPDGLEKEISPADMAHLIGYLREALRANTPSSKKDEGRAK
jgi:putative membrane-bound dehydrogenase-like protein